MSVGLQKLDFMVSLLDKVSGPAKGIMSTMDKVTTNVQKGYRKIGYGTAGLVGAGYAIDRLIAPTKALNKALGEVDSLNVADGVLEKLTATSLKFSTAYGESAVDFVRSSYDIQSAIGGLVGGELATFTEASAILAKGTKSDTATITSFVGTMYGIFKTNADAMGKGQWVQQLAGQTALAVQMFKTTGSEMSAAFGNVGAEGTAMGVSMNEQLAILGTLQATMSGTEAGTKYKSFLAGVGKAQKTLGLTFTDSQGKMLPMVEILEKIKGKFGAIDTVAESDLLQKAFGRKEAAGLIKLLINDVDGLSQSINQIGAQNGMGQAIEMAQKIADPFEIAGAQVTALQTKIGLSLMPTIHSVLALFGTAAAAMMGWMDQYPTLTEYLGVAAIGVVGLIVAISALSIAVGIGSFLSAGWTLAMSGGTLVMGLWNKATLLAAAGQRILNMAMKMNPIGLMITGLTAAIYYWDELKSMALGSLNAIIDGINLIPGIDIPNIDIGSTVQPPKPIETNATRAINGSAQGGVINRISNATSSNSKRSIKLDVHNYGQAMSGQQLMDEMAFMGG